MYIIVITLHRVMRIILLLLLLLLPPPLTPCIHIDNFIFKYSIILKIYGITFIIYINIIYKRIFIFQHSFQIIQHIFMFGYAPNPLCPRNKLCFTWLTIMLLNMLFHVPFVSSTKWWLIKLFDSTRFPPIDNVLCDAGCYVIPRHSVTIYLYIIQVRMPIAWRLRMTWRPVIVLLMERTNLFSVFRNRYRVFPGCKAAGSWGWPLTPIQCRGYGKSKAIHLLALWPFWLVLR
jgi:hypothetical protein